MAAIALGSFGVLSLILAAVGIYGVMSHVVAGRTREIGLRMALGAQFADVRRLILRQGMLLAVIGSIVGLIIALSPPDEEPALRRECVRSGYLFHRRAHPSRRRTSSLLDSGAAGHAGRSDGRVVRGVGGAISAAAGSSERAARLRSREANRRSRYWRER
jgi:hypothetical protein